MQHTLTSTTPPTVLYQALKEVKKDLPLLLTLPWNSLFVDYHHPYVERLWRQWGSYRIYLHRILPCEPDQALFHPHAAPSIMEIYEGTYAMDIGAGAGDDPPPVVSTLILPPGTIYSMPHPDGWHSVRPTHATTMSLMLSGTPWSRKAPKPTKELGLLSIDQGTRILDFFTAKYPRVPSR